MRWQKTQFSKHLNCTNFSSAKTGSADILCRWNKEDNTIKYGTMMIFAFFFTIFYGIFYAIFSVVALVLKAIWKILTFLLRFGR